MSKQTKRRKTKAKKSATKRPAGKKAATRKSARKRAAKKTSARRKAAPRKAVRKKTATKRSRRKAGASKRSARDKKFSYLVEPFHSATPMLIVRNGPAALDFYKRAFGAVERYRVTSPDGRLLNHGEVLIGNSVIMLADEVPEMSCRAPASLGNTSVFIYLYVKDVDATFQQAVAAGAAGTQPPQDMFWGDRVGQVTDPFGHMWSIASHLRDMSMEEIRAASAAH